MADANQAAEELAKTMAKVQEELSLLGRVSQQTQTELKDATMKAKYGVENFTSGTTKAAEGVAALGRAGMAAGKAMLDGKKGAAALNSSLDELSSAATAAGAALALMIPGGILIKGLIAGITAATTAYIKYTQAANEMADQLHKGYTGLAKAGGAAADGMTGLKNDAQKLGLAMTELDQMVSLVTENSKEFALFAGSVGEGRKKFADMGKAMEPARHQLLNMGMEVKDINEGMAGYVRLQTRLGNAQQMSVNQLAKGATEYLKEQDALTKLTGQSRAEMEQQRERALQGEQFAAKVRELQLSGNQKAAEELMKLNSIYEAAGPKMASAFQASVTGNLSNKDAQEANLASQGEMIRTTQQVIAGQMSYTDAAQKTGVAMGKTADTVGTTLGQLGAYNGTFGPIHEQLKLAQLTQGDITKNMTQIKADQEKQMGGADKITDSQSRLIESQIAANKAMTDFVFAGIGPAQEKMIELTNATDAAAKGLAMIAGGDTLSAKEKSQDEKNWEKFSAMEKVESGLARGIEKLTGVFSTGGQTFLARERMKNENEYLQKEGRYEEVDGARAGGGPVDAGKLYKVGEKGEEFFKPNVAGEIVPHNQIAGLTGAAASRTEQIEKASKEIVADTKTLEKITDGDTKRAKEYSNFYQNYVEDMTEIMKKQLDAANEEQQQMSSGGGGGILAALGLKPPGMGGGPGLKMPSGGATNMQAGLGLKATSQDDLKGMGLKLKAGDVQAEGAGISPNIIELAKSVQGGVPGFNVFTGFNDKFHSEKAPSSQHTKGLAMDFTVAEKPTPEQGAQVVAWLKQQGASLAIDEYNNPSGHATAGHFHAQVPAFKDGGLVDEATLSMIGEAGPEAVIPLKDGNVPVSFNGKIGLGDEAMALFKAMADQSAAMTAMMQEMITAQKNSVDVQSKMLRAQS